MNSPKKPTDQLRISVDPSFIEDLQWWTEAQPRTATRVLKLVSEIQRTPFDGIGKPERLRHLEVNTWSRRITEEHRLVYRVEKGWVYLLQCRYHY
jgi:toxin YoeB